MMIEYSNHKLNTEIVEVKELNLRQRGILCARLYQWDWNYWFCGTKKKHSLISSLQDLH
jgi:hypothetical protein